ncbi:DnaA N-terminal domain-containing protein [Eubacterium sp.]|uniref:DnaA N-terminal domain-containing protein n=1 Tax=Eubacterium sp. TaxID=142586 RepID=UPI003F03BEFD
MTNDNDLIWEGILKFIYDRTAEVAFKLWITPLKFYGIEDNTAYIASDKEICNNVVKRAYDEMLKEAFLHVTGKQVEIVYCTK